MQTTIPKPNKRQEPSEVNGQNQSQVTPKPKAKSHELWAISQVKPSEAKAKSQSQKPKAKWARKWEILAPKCKQNTDFSSKMQQIARKAAPGWKTEKKMYVYIYTPSSPNRVLATVWRTFCQSHLPKEVQTLQFFALLNVNSALATVWRTFCRPHLPRVLRTLQLLNRLTFNILKCKPSSRYSLVHILPTPSSKKCSAADRFF